MLLRTATLSPLSTVEDVILQYVCMALILGTPHVLRDNFLDKKKKNLHRKLSLLFSLKSCTPFGAIF